MGSNVDQKDEKARQLTGLPRHFRQFAVFAEIMRDVGDVRLAHFVLFVT